MSGSMPTPVEPPFDAALLRRLGSTPQEAKALLQNELGAFEALLVRLEPRWTTAPREGAWCPAQVVEHVMKVNDATSKILHLLNRDAPLPHVARTPGELRGGRPQAPAPLRPGEPQAFGAVREGWQASRRRFLAEVAKTTDWSGRTFYHPFFGDLTALQWVQAMSFHNAHHRKGLERDLRA
jgi:hypothetical protein